MKLLLSISFVGTNYCGYQVQPNGITVQQRLTEAAQKLFGYPCDIVGCSRTDSGVHANQFCATVSKKKESFLDTSIPIERIPMAFTNNLPDDIAVWDAKWVSDDFHPRYGVKYKEYVYKILNFSVRDPFLNERVWHCPKSIDDVALNKMNDAARQYIGTHDFTSFMASDSKITDATRTVFDAEIYRENDKIIVFKVSADGFLYNMVRIMVGTLIDVAYGKLAPEDILKIIDAKDRKLAGQTAPPSGLYLNKVIYD